MTLLVRLLVCASLLLQATAICFDGEPCDDYIHFCGDDTPCPDGLVCGGHVCQAAVDQKATPTSYDLIDNTLGDYNVMCGGPLQIDCPVGLECTFPPDCIDCEGVCLMPMPDIPCDPSAPACPSGYVCAAVSEIDYPDMCVWDFAPSSSLAADSTSSSTTTCESSQECPQGFDCVTDSDQEGCDAASGAGCTRICVQSSLWTEQEEQFVGRSREDTVVGGHLGGGDTDTGNDSAARTTRSRPTLLQPDRSSILGRRNGNLRRRRG